MKKTLLALFALAGIAHAHAQNPYPVIPIDTAQFVSSSKLSLTPPNDSSDYVNPILQNSTYGDTVRVEGVVLMNPKIYALSANRKATYIMNEAGGPWSGIEVMCDPTTVGAPNLTTLIQESKFYDNMVMGYKVRVTGVLRQFNGSGVKYGETQLNVIRANPNFSTEIEQISLTPVAVTPNQINISDLMAGNTNSNNRAIQKTTGEQWEGTYAEFKNITVASVPTQNNTTKRWTWTVGDDQGNQINVYDPSGYFFNGENEDTVPKIPNTFTPPVFGTNLSYLRGVIVEATLGGIPMYTICPLAPGDIGISSYSSPKILSAKKTPSIITPTDSVLISATTKKGTRVIAGSKLYYAVGYSNTVFDSVDMTKGTNIGDTIITWEAKIPTHTAGSIVKYWIKVTDSNNVSVNYPDNFGTNSAYLVVNDAASISISTLQNSPYSSYSTIFNGDSLSGISLRGIVTGNAFSSSSQNLLTIQDGTGANSAIFIQRGTGDPTNTWNVGDSVEITSAKVTETFNTTILYNIRGNVISSNNPLPPFEMNLPLDSFVQNRVLYARPWEAVLVKWDNVFITNVNPDGPSSNNGEFSFHTDKTKTGLRTDDMNSELRNLNSKIKKDMPMDFIQGAMWFSFSNFKVIPRNRADIDLSHLDTLAPVVTLIGNQYDTIEINTPYVDMGATALDNIDGDITSSIVVTGSVDIATLGDYILTYTATDAWGNSDSAKRYVHVKTLVGIHENELLAASVSIFPSPATNEITIAANGIVSLPIDIKIIDILGREVLTKQLKQGSFKETLNISSLNNGAYFCIISNDKGSRTVKFMVNGK